MLFYSLSLEEEMRAKEVVNKSLTLLEDNVIFEKSLSEDDEKETNLIFFFLNEP